MPAPLSPTIPTQDPFFIIKFIFFKISKFESEYLKDILFKIISLLKINGLVKAKYSDLFSPRLNSNFNFSIDA